MELLVKDTHRPTNRRTNIATYRADITAENATNVSKSMVIDSKSQSQVKGA